jgi:hypothetical protein
MRPCRTSWKQTQTSGGKDHAFGPVKPCLATDLPRMTGLLPTLITSLPPLVADSVIGWTGQNRGIFSSLVVCNHARETSLL